MTNPNNAIGTNAAFGGRTSVNAFNDDLNIYSRGIISGWTCSPASGMTVQLGGDGVSRDVAAAEDNAGNKTSINNISGSPISVTLAAAPATNNRIDAIVAYVDNPATGTATIADNPSACGIIAVSGTTASNPSAPTESQIRSAITADGATGATAYYVVLATIRVGTGVTTIGSGVITQGAKVETGALAGTNTVGTAALQDGSVTSDKVDWTTLDYASSANSGRVKIGPLLIQWGRASIYVGSGAPAESSALSVTFPKAYSVAPVVQLQMEDIGGICGEYSAIFGTTTSGFTGAIGHALAADAGTRYCRWLAVGTSS